MELKSAGMEKNWGLNQVWRLCVLDQGTLTQNPPNGAGTGAALQLAGRLLGP